MKHTHTHRMQIVIRLPVIDRLHPPWLHIPPVQASVLLLTTVEMKMAVIWKAKCQLGFHFVLEAGQVAVKLTSRALEVPISGTKQLTVAAVVTGAKKEETCSILNYEYI